MTHLHKNDICCSVTSIIQLLDKCGLRSPDNFQTVWSSHSTQQTTPRRYKTFMRNSCRILAHYCDQRMLQQACLLWFVWQLIPFQHFLWKIASASLPVSAFIEFLFSSPEHYVLRVSYCDRSLSGVRPSVNNYLKILLLWNRSTDFSETSQKLSLGDALSKYFKDLNSMENSGCHGNREKKL